MAASTAHGKVPNRLAKEKSPYLLQHQYNPVDWYPWGEEAISKARAENKLIFLSVGYSTCHWCHVMEKTTFEIEDAAKVMNREFINIKVDREERPDVDKVYMTYILATTGHGGWPMSIFIEPHSLAPLFGGTYYPAHREGRRPGFIDICTNIAANWAAKKDAMLDHCKTTAEQLKMHFEGNGGEMTQREKILDHLDKPLMKGATQRVKSFDPVYGGWGGQPKFPQPVILNAMYAAHFKQGTPTSEFLTQVEMTLQQMYRGGIHDHLGGGFHRYSVTEEWKLPHFEKMLYDQAQLAYAYVTAFQITRNEIYRSAAEDIFKYVSTQLTDRSTGGFFSAEDADSPLAYDRNIKREGAFYVWDYEEIENLLSPEEFAVIKPLYDIREEGNVPSEYDPHGEMEKKNILHSLLTLEEVNSLVGYGESRCKELIQSAHAKLYEAQQKRPRPHLDDKIVTVWNGMMIQALAKGYEVFSDQKLLDLALAATKFIRSQMWIPERRRLLRSYREGPSHIEAFADDYTAMIAAMLDLYEATFDVSHLQWALELQATLDELFWDNANKGYFCDSGSADLHLMARTKDDHDGSEPSYNSVAANSLVRLYHLLQREEFKTRAEDIFIAFSTNITRMPLAVPMMTVAAAAYESAAKSIVVYGPLENKETKEFIKAIYSTYDPFRVVMQTSHDNSDKTRFFSEQGVTMFKDVSADLSVGGKPAVYICQDFMCLPPITDVDSLKVALTKN